jgi:hypothetical protein
MPLILALVWVLASVLVGLAGRDRALGFWGFFITSLILTPITCVLLLLLTAPAARRG